MLGKALKIGAATFVAYKLVSWVNYIRSEEHTLDTTIIKSRKEREGLHSPITRLSYFLNADGLYIYWRKWAPSNPDKAKAIIVIVHGLGEHCARYEHVARAFVAQGYVVYSMDHQGHGKSEGNRVYAKRFSDFPEDVLLLADIAKKENPRKKAFLLGHSMGSLISIHTAIKSPSTFEGVALSAPPLKIDEKMAPKWQRDLLSTVAESFPKLPTPNIVIDTLCRDKGIVDSYVNDPLVNHGLLTARLTIELLKAVDQAQLFAKQGKVKFPYLLMHGTDDRVCLPEGSREFHRASSSTDKTFVEYDLAYHELLNEPDHQDKALKDILEWISERV